jgi:hypothetical protein
VVADRLRGRRAALMQSRSSRLIDPGIGVDVEPHRSIRAERAGVSTAGPLNEWSPGRHVMSPNSGARVDCSRLRRRARVFTHKAG